MRREQVPQIHTNLFYDLHISTLAHAHIHTLLVVDYSVCINLRGGDCAHNSHSQPLGPLALAFTIERGGFSVQD